MARGMFDYQPVRDAAWSNGGKVSMCLHSALPSHYLLLISQQTHRISLCIHLMLFCKDIHEISESVKDLF